MHSLNKRVVLNEQCLVLQPTLVIELGRSAAMVLQQIHYWMGCAKLGKTINGERWIYNSYESWVEDIKIYSISSIRRAIAKLEAMGLLKSAFLSSKKSDRTKWYAINYDKVNEFKCSDTTCTHQTADSKMDNPSAQNEPIINKENKDNFKKTIQSSEKEISPSLQESSIAQCMILIWNDTVGEGRATSLTPKRSSFLTAAFHTKFNRSIEAWQSFCDSISSSDFLMGRVKTSFRASLDWILKFDIIQRVLEGDFGVKPTSHNESPFPEDSLDEIQHNILQLSESDRVKSLRQKILTEFGSASYITWFSSLKIEEGEGAITLLCPSAFRKAYIQSHFGLTLSKWGGVVR